MYRNVNETMEKYGLSDPWDIVTKFEDLVAEYAGAPYAVALDSCTNALFLCLKYLKATGEIELPNRTYVSVPQSVIHAGCKPKFIDYEWEGLYQLKPYNVLDSAGRFRKGMYVPGNFQCLSFHCKKILAISKGGMILCHSKEAADWFRLAIYEGRDRKIPHDIMPETSVLGWNFYMPPEQASFGLELFEKLPDFNKDSTGSYKYKDISKWKIFNQ